MNAKVYDMMENVFYGLTEERFYDGETYRCSYGIAVYAESDCGGTDCVLETVSDITSDRKSLEELILQCNLQKLSPIHLHDVIEDFFAQM